MPIEAKKTQDSSESSCVLAVKEQERGAAVSAGDQGVSRGVRGVTRALTGHHSVRHMLKLLPRFVLERTELSSVFPL